MEWGLRCIWRRWINCVPSLRSTHISFSFGVCLLIHARANFCLPLISFLSRALVHDNNIHNNIHVLTWRWRFSILFNVYSALWDLPCIHVFVVAFAPFFCFFILSTLVTHLIRLYICSCSLSKFAVVWLKYISIYCPFPYSVTIAQVKTKHHNKMWLILLLIVFM